MAHPDDVEFLCAGTLARLRRMGHTIHIATMTAGDGGSAELTNEDIARIRYGEAEASARILNASYQCAHAQDFFVSFEPRNLRAVIEVVRRANPSIVITHSPSDYMTDHEETSKLVRAACFAAPAPNAHTRFEEAADCLSAVPALYYADAIEGKDILGHTTPIDFFVDISEDLETKTHMLACHKSQRDWLMKQHGLDQYLEFMKSWARRRGLEAGVYAAEAFIQHKGHGYPQVNRLVEILGQMSAVSA